MECIAKYREIVCFSSYNGVVSPLFPKCNKGLSVARGITAHNGRMSVFASEHFPHLHGGHAAITHVHAVCFNGTAQFGTAFCQYDDALFMAGRNDASCCGFCICIGCIVCETQCNPSAASCEGLLHLCFYFCRREGKGEELYGYHMCGKELVLSRCKYEVYHKITKIQQLSKITDRIFANLVRSRYICNGLDCVCARSIRTASINHQT